MVKTALIGGGLAVLVAAHPAPGGLTFTPADILGWPAKLFRGETRYAGAEVDGRPAVRADCDGSASMLLLQRSIDLAATPIVEWSWGVEGIFDGAAEEQRRDGDDYAARLYVVSGSFLNPLELKAINYVWASRMPAGADWPSAYAPQSRVVAVRSGRPDGAMPWKTERRDIRADFRRYHGVDIDALDAIAIMTDCDDRRAMAAAWYGPLRFLPADG